MEEGKSPFADPGAIPVESGGAAFQKLSVDIRAALWELCWWQSWEGAGEATLPHPKLSWQRGASPEQDHGAAQALLGSLHIPLPEGRAIPSSCRIQGPVTGTPRAGFGM